MGTKSPIVDVLRQALARAEESQHAISEATGVDRVTLWRFLRGDGIPGGKKLDALAEHFGLELRPVRRSGRSG